MNFEVVFGQEAAAVGQPQEAVHEIAAEVFKVTLAFGLHDLVVDRGRRGR